MTQLDLVLAPAVARLSDPGSSKLSAFEQTESGRVRTHARMVLEVQNERTWEQKL